MARSGNSVNKWNGSGLYRQFADAILRPLINSPGKSSVLVMFYLTLLVSAFFFTRVFDSSHFLLLENSTHQTILTQRTTGRHMHRDTKNSRVGAFTHSGSNTTQTTETISGYTRPSKTTRNVSRKTKIPLSCSDEQICPTNYPKKLELDPHAPPPPTCPNYFRGIYEDLSPWSKVGISEEMVARARRTANFKLVILDGKAYVERYQKSFQTRDVFTLWGISQLLRKYPGRVPDLELMFDCVDWPVLLYKYFNGTNAKAPPPLFRYCGNENTFDIVFPDWSFWGWAEIGIKPWEIYSKELKEGNKKMKWRERDHYAYWKGNPFVSPSRMDLLHCNISDKMDWRTRVYIQDWAKEVQQGFKNSDLASQCVHRYKIYIEGSAWSVSEKYILACDSVPLIVNPHYYDFFSRGLIPTQHYWPIKENDKCRSIKHAVEWGDSHVQKAEAIGKAASDYIHKDVKMDYVYDYMLHLLTEYAKLFKYKPTIPPNATELCSETLACHAEGLEKKFMMDSLVKSPSDTGPCTMPPPYNWASLQAMLKRKADAEGQVEKLEKDYWANQTITAQ